MFFNLPKERFSVIAVDPPWDYRQRLQHGKRKSSGGAADHYPTISIDDLKTFPIKDLLAKDAIVFMWATAPLMHDAIDLGRAWDLHYGTVAFVWDKLKVNPGYYTLSQCEYVLCWKRGKIPQPRGIRNARQLVIEKRTEHSTKPDEVYHRIEAMFPHHNKLELFAREPRGGWTVWGNEVTKKKGKK